MKRRKKKNQHKEYSMESLVDPAELQRVKGFMRIGSPPLGMYQPSFQRSASLFHPSAILSSQATSGACLSTPWFNGYPLPTELAKSHEWVKSQPEYKELEQKLADADAERMGVAILWGKEREANKELRKRIAKLEENT